jgi:hypothetical protein
MAQKIVKHEGRTYTLEPHVGERVWVSTEGGPRFSIEGLRAFRLNDPNDQRDLVESYHIHAGPLPAPQGDADMARPKPDDFADAKARLAAVAAGPRKLAQTDQVPTTAEGVRRLAAAARAGGLALVDSIAARMAEIGREAGEVAEMKDAVPGGLCEEMRQIAEACARHGQTLAALRKKTA